MTVILSRKGIDSSSGGMYSPLNGKTGEYVFIPKPESKNQISRNYKGIDYNRLKINFMNFDNIFEILETRKRIPKYGAHLDPDLIQIFPTENWRPIFGQKGSAQGYLRNCGVGQNSIGAIFLFFSRFSPWEKYDNILTEGYYIYGWIHVGEIIKPTTKNKEYSYHPHLKDSYLKDKNNILYIASKNIIDTNLPGAGMFKKLTKDLRLSNYELRNLLTFKLPLCSYNGFTRFKNYQKLRKGFCLADWPQSFGQEAVCSAEMNPARRVSNTKKWAINLISKNIEFGGLKHDSL